VIRYALFSDAEPILLFACDRTGLDDFIEFIARVRREKPQGPLALDAGAGFERRGACDAVLLVDGQQSRAHVEESGRLVWHISEGALDRALELMRGLRDSDGAGHQYLEEDGPIVIQGRARSGKTRSERRLACWE
jgi:hypothetical protein